MLRPKAKWKVADPKPDEARQLAEEIGTSPLVAQLLLNRNIRTVEQGIRFLHTERQQFHDPFLLTGMKETVERLKTAVRNGEPILIFGDYDADGVTSTSIMVYVLKEIGAKADYYIPNRFTEGYGPNKPALQQAKETGYHVVITVDTGIAALDEAEAAKQLGIDFIITDHHQPPPVLPNAYSIVNPHQNNCLYPFKELSGAGVAFKVAHALLGQIPVHLLEFAALGTIADLVPLIEENRLIATRGITAMKGSEKPGIRALLKVAGLHKRMLSAEDVGFKLGPRLNAAGRLHSAELAARLLLSDNAGEAKQLAEEIDRMNSERKALVDEITSEAIAEIEAQTALMGEDKQGSSPQISNIQSLKSRVEERLSHDDHYVFVVAKEGWNAGVIGIVASRLVDRYCRPVIVMGIDRKTGIAKGSARSIDGFDMFENLLACRDLLPHFGGHPMAAGMTLKAENIDELRTRLNGQASEILTPEDLTHVLHIDLNCKVSDTTFELIEEMQRLAPFGTANPTPKIIIEDTPLTKIKQIGNEKNHLKTAFGENGVQLEGIGFRLGHLFHEITNRARISAVGEVQVNEWNGYRKPQLVIEDVAVREWQLFDFRNGRDLKNRFDSLPKDKLLLVSFRKETVEHLGLLGWGKSIHFITNEIPDPEDFSERYVVFLDLPNRTEQLQALFGNHTMPERIYAVFHHEGDHFFSSVPSRDHFKWFWAFLFQKKSFNLNRYAEQLAKAKGLSKETVTFMAEVFAELDFITIENDVISLAEQPSKRDLADSSVYRERQQQVKVESDLCYSSYSSLKQWFDEINTESKSLEGAVK